MQWTQFSSLTAYVSAYGCLRFTDPDDTPSIYLRRLSCFCWNWYIIYIHFRFCFGMVLIRIICRFSIRLRTVENLFRLKRQFNTNLFFFVIYYFTFVRVYYLVVQSLVLPTNNTNCFRFLVHFRYGMHCTWIYHLTNAHINILTHTHIYTHHPRIWAGKREWGRKRKTRSFTQQYWCDIRQQKHQMKIVAN